MITINGKEVPFKEGQTVLKAARDAGIYIPTLCTHSELEPFGACRTCIVKIDGLRGFPTSCTTLVKDGMTIKTEEKELQILRKNVLEMILLEHPNTCIVCSNKDECEECHFAPSKAGRITGCQFCPNKEKCEVREVADYLGLKDLSLPFSYKGLPIERDDPFFDRDYNLCILCGRCVRVCQDIRGAGTLAFTQRSNRTKVGTAFDKLHIDSNCGFCGACVDVCPTGSLSARGSKWHGDADECTDSVCLLCSVGCTFSFESKWNRVMAAVPKKDGPTKGQTCSKGRFCIPPLLNGADRLKQPMIRMNGKLIPVSWEDAIAYATEKLGQFKPDDIGIIASSFLTNEAAYILQKLARTVFRTNNIGTTNSDFVMPTINTIKASGYGNSAKNKTQTIEESKWIIILGDRLLHPPNALIPSIYTAKKAGAKIVLIDSNTNTKAPLKIIDITYNLRSSETLNLFHGIIHKLYKSNPNIMKQHENHEAFTESIKNVTMDKLENVSDKVEEIAKIVSSGNGSIIFSEDALRISNPGEIVKAIMNTLILTRSPDGFVPFYEEGNAQGIYDMGAIAQYLPGHAPISKPESIERFSESWGVALSEKEGKSTDLMLNGGVKALYLTESVHIENLDNIEFLILQDIYPSKIMDKADVVFPACAFTEESGTVTSFEGRTLSINQVVKAQGSAMPDWKIICDLAKKMGAKGFDYESSHQIFDEIKDTVPFITEKGSSRPKDRPLGLLPFDMKACKDLPQYKPRYRYRAANLTERVEDFKIQIQASGGI